MMYRQGGTWVHVPRRSWNGHACNWCTCITSIIGPARKQRTTMIDHQLALVFNGVISSMHDAEELTFRSS